MTTRPEKIQIVWDAGCNCTAQTTSGCCMRVGPAGDWSPEQLLLTATESSLMSSFLELAEERGLEILGYVSSAGVIQRGRTGRRARLVVRPCIAIAAETDRPRVHELLGAARERSVVARALGRSLHVAPEVVILPVVPLEERG